MHGLWLMNNGILHSLNSISIPISFANQADAISFTIFSVRFSFGLDMIKRLRLPLEALLADPEGSHCKGGRGGRRVLKISL